MDKERAITNAINAAVEAFIADDLEYADECFEKALELHRETSIPTTQGAANDI